MGLLDGRGGRPLRLPGLAPWVALALLAAWTWHPSPWWLFAVAASVLLSAVSAPAADFGFRTRAPALVLLLLAVPLGFLSHHRLARPTSDWEGYWNEREGEVFGELTDALEELVLGGDETVERLAEIAEASGGRPPRQAVEELRKSTGFAALAIYGPLGDPLVWTGTHRGRVLEDAQLGTARYLYGELPLFGYLYFTEPLPSSGGTAVVAALLRSDLPAGLRARPGDFVSRFERRTGEEIGIARSERAGAGAAFDFVWETDLGRDTLFSVAVVRPSEVERHEELRNRWIRLVTVLVVAAWVLLAVGGLGGRETVPAVATLFLLGAILPLDALVGTNEWFRAADFHLAPGPLEISLGRALVLLVVTVAAGAILRGHRGFLGAAAGGAVAAALFPLVTVLVVGSASPGFLGGVEAGWVAFQLALSVALALVAGAGLLLVRRRPEAPRRTGRIVLGLALAAALGALAAASASELGDLPLWATAAWGLPVAVLASCVRSWSGWRRSLLVWGAATVLGTSAGLPVAWHARTDARIAVAEEQMRRLGADVNPYLDFLLGRLAREVQSFHARGAGPVELLYRGWLDSGLAREGYPIWLTLWGPGGLPQEEFPMGVTDPRPGVAARYAEEARESGETSVHRLRLPDAHYLVTVPLSDGTVVTGVVPPRKELGTASPLGPLFGGLSGEEEDPLTLVPLLPEDEPTSVPDLRWVRTEEGWQGEMLLDYPDQRFHAHYLVELPGPLVLVARAVLLVVLDLAVVLLVWAAARVVLLGSRPTSAGLGPLVGSFRARVTIALFGFFVLSNAIFGTLAYRTISGAAERAARVLAERIARDGAGVYNEMGGEMELLARQVGAHLLEYRHGELREGSAEELVQLGLFEGWLPWDVNRRLSTREDILATRESRLGRWEYVTAFRSLPDGDVLAAPVPLQAGATAVRREEVAHLLGAALVVGGLLSLVLALLVGRTLARPIQTLQVASERVGAGNLGVRLPSNRSDEFGSVFTAFNRMVRRLRRARRDLVRTTRRTQAIVEDAATGVIALDPGGRVTLANPRAAELLGRNVEVGASLREEGGASDAFVAWVKLYFRDGLRELGGEFQFEDRRVRVRARRIEREGSLGGAVISLEDVTDELRTERVLAWGEMARQVAHEVKNPLTPIKLSLQHIRRAWDDRRPEFGEILTRNADAALAEIDRLAAIASSFSRFGAPTPAGESPLGPVRLHGLVGEVMTLYQSGEGGVRFETDVSPDLPPVRARESEVKEVLVNLLENARAAIQDEGRVRIEGRAAAGGVVLAVEDDGAGIPPELLPRVFEPHFSTRSAGTGLGLAIVKRLVEGWEGTVSIESEPGQGTVVRLGLRVWESTPADRRGEPDEGAGGSGASPADTV